MEGRVAVLVLIIGGGAGAVLVRIIEGGVGDGLVRIIEGGVGAVQVAKIGHIQNKLPSALPIRQFYGGFLGAGGGAVLQNLMVLFRLKLSSSCDRSTLGYC